MSSKKISPASLRRIILEESKRAHVGHIGSALSVTEIISVLYSDVLHIARPDDPERDRFGRVVHFGTFNASPLSAAAGLATLRITADPALAVEDERNRADNSFSLSLDIAAAPSGNGDSSGDGDGDGFSIPGFGLAGALLSAAIVARRRR